LTRSNSEFQRIEKDIIQEIEIQPSKVSTFKVEYHKDFVKNWLIQTNSNFDEI